MDVVNKIQNVNTQTLNNFRNVPTKNIIIFNIEQISEPSELLIQNNTKTDK
jgi:hypothetical protein